MKPEPGTRVQYVSKGGSRGVIGIIVAGDDERIPRQHRRVPAGYEAVYVLYDDPIDVGPEWESAYDGYDPDAGRWVDHGPTYGGWFRAENLEGV